MWGLAALFYAYGFFQRVAPSVIVDDLMRDLALSGALLGTLSAAYFYAYAGLQIPIGLLLDRFGPRIVLTVGAALATLGGVLFAQAASLEAAVAARALIGAGVGVGYISALTLAGNWFTPQRFGLVAGLTLTAGTLGAVLGQLPLALMVAAFGWRACLLVIALAGGVLTAALLAFVRDRPARAAASSATGGRRLLAPLLALAGRGEIWAYFLMCGLIGAPILAFAGLWGVPYFVHVHELTRPQASLATSAMLLAWSAGGPVFGWLAGRVERPTSVIVAAAVVALVVWAGLAAIDGLPLPVVTPAVVLAGFSGGSMIAVFALTRSRFAGEVAGTALGLVNTGVLLAGAALQTLVGWLLDLGWRGDLVEGARLYPPEAYRWGFVAFAAAASIVALVALGLATIEARRRSDPRSLIPRGHNR